MARDEATRQSDIDLLVDGGDELDHFLLARAWRGLLRRRVDLVTLATLTRWDDSEQARVARDAIALHRPTDSGLFPVPQERTGHKPLKISSAEPRAVVSLGIVSRTERRTA